MSRIAVPPRCIIGGTGSKRDGERRRQRKWVSAALCVGEPLLSQEASRGWRGEGFPMTAEPWPLPRLCKWTNKIRGRKTYLSVVSRGRLRGRLDFGGEDQSRAGPREGEAGTASLGGQVHSPIGLPRLPAVSRCFISAPAIPQEHLQAIKTLTCVRPRGN